MTPEQIKKFLALRREEYENRLLSIAKQISGSKRTEQKQFFEQEKTYVLGRLDQLSEFKSIMEGKI